MWRSAELYPGQEESVGPSQAHAWTEQNLIRVQRETLCCGTIQWNWSRGKHLNRTHPQTSSYAGKNWSLCPTDKAPHGVKSLSGVMWYQLLLVPSVVSLALGVYWSHKNNCECWIRPALGLYWQNMEGCFLLQLFCVKKKSQLQLEINLRRLWSYWAFLNTRAEICNKGLKF